MITSSRESGIATIGFLAFAARQGVKGSLTELCYLFAFSGLVSVRNGILRWYIFLAFALYLERGLQWG
jgi:hypothetical protein